jgi:hypothetical protein
VIDVGAPQVLVHRASTSRGSALFAHDLAGRPATVCRPGPPVPEARPADVFRDQDYGVPDLDRLELDGYGFRWIRLAESHTSATHVRRSPRENPRLDSFTAEPTGSGCGPSRNGGEMSEIEETGTGPDAKRIGQAPTTTDVTDPERSSRNTAAGSGSEPGEGPVQPAADEGVDPSLSIEPHNEGLV